MPSTDSQIRQAAHSTHSVLVVDDEPEIRDSLHDLLEECGYTVSCASNGEEALDFIRSHAPPHVIVLDLIMPRMNGFELLRRIRRDPTLSDCYVIVVSATDRPTGLSADAFFQKPYSVSQLVRKVEQLCIAHDEMSKFRRH